MKRTLCVGTTILWLLGGCASKSLPPTQRYVITPQTPHIERTARSQPLFDTLAIRLFADTPIAATTGIYYREKNYRQQPYAFSRWYAPPRQMLKDKLLIDLQKSGIARVVTTQRFTAQSTLEVRVLDCVQIFPPHGHAYVHIVLQAALTYHKKTSTELFESTHLTPKPTAQGAVEAFNVACDRLVLEIVHWSERVGEARQGREN